jgi:hypothetical protein
MKNSITKSRGTGGARKLALALLLFAFVSSMAAFPNGALTARSSSGQMLGISVINNADREIRHLYLSPVNQNSWGPDLLDGRVVKKGESFQITDAACQGYEIKVIAEDQQGCFSYGVVTCAEASTSWTITNDTPADCG